MGKRRILGIAITIIGLIMTLGVMTRYYDMMAIITWVLVTFVGLVLFFWGGFPKAKVTTTPKIQKTLSKNSQPPFKKILLTIFVVIAISIGGVLFFFKDYLPYLPMMISMMKAQDSMNPFGMMTSDTMRPKSLSDMKNMMNMQQIMEKMGQDSPLISVDDIFKQTPCDTAKKVRVTNITPYYSGPLIDSHIHLPMVIKVPDSMAHLEDVGGFNIKEVVGTATFGRDITVPGLICQFDATNTKSAIGFYGLMELMPDQTLKVVKEAEKRYPGRIAAFLIPAPYPKPMLPSDKLDKVLSDNKGLFKGYGELAVYRDEFKNMSLTDTNFKAVYKVAKKHNIIIMIHPVEDYQHPMGLKALEQAIKENPQVKFLIHGVNKKENIMPILDKYKNAYFTIDENIYRVYDEKLKYFRGILGSVENFKKDPAPMVELCVNLWKEAIEKYLDQIMWGTDKEVQSHYDPQVGQLVAEFARACIGRLDPKVQEKFAYKNAEKLLQN